MMHIEEARNKAITDKFNLYWINVLKNVIMEWYNKFSPEFICVRRKPNNDGNERHVIFYGITQILWRAQIVEGKDRPAQLDPNIQSKIGRTVGIMLWMCEPLFYMVKAVFVDSGFCVANGIVALGLKGVYTGSLIKKHLYWPNSVLGYITDRNFVVKKVEDVEMLQTAKQYGNPFLIL